MAPEQSKEDEEEEEKAAAALAQAPSHHPPPPSSSSELFDISTTVDPSYIISLIRKLLPHNGRNNRGLLGVNNCDTSVQRSETEMMDESVPSNSHAGVQNFRNDKADAMYTIEDVNGSACQKESDEVLLRSLKDPEAVTVEEAWEEYGCILWDLAAHKIHAEFMVENLLLEVLLASLSVSQSTRITEICLGIIGNLACHEAPQTLIVSMKGLIETVVDQLFLDDSPCLCETFRLLTLGLQGSGSVTWAEAFQAEQILRRIFWIAENTLNSQLLEKTIGLFLAILDNQQVAPILLPPLMELGLASLLINLLAFEVNKLTSERLPDRYSVLDLILRAVEGLSVTDNYSEVISSNEELLRLVYDLVKLPDKVEVASSCVTAVVLIANILADVPGLALEISKDLSFLQGLLGMFPFVSNDSEARNALWSVLAAVLVRVQEEEMNLPFLAKYVSALVEKSEVIEEDLIDHQQEDYTEDNKSLSAGIKLNVRTSSLSRILNILNQWTTLREDASKKDLVPYDHVGHGKVDRLRHCCRKYIE